MDIPLKVVDQGLYCTAGDFFIDAWRPTPLCFVTHAHGDHAYWGHSKYIASKETVEIIKRRFRIDAPMQALEYGEKIKLGDAWVSLHPAGHILGSSQIRIETPQAITVVSGDYKRALDSTCLPFEVIECDIFVTESTFALPIYHWPENELICGQIMRWWEENASNGHPSVLFSYSLGKAQRVMAMLAEKAQKPIYLHGAVFAMSSLYRELNVNIGDFNAISESQKGTSFAKELIIAPPSAQNSPWLRRFPSCRTAIASGWMQVRGTRRRKAVDQGFVLSDHADWPALIQTVEQCKAKTVLTTHGNCATLAKYLREEKKLDARELHGLEIIEEEED